MDTKKILINSFKAGLEAVKPENIIKNKFHFSLVVKS